MTVVVIWMRMNWLTRKTWIITMSIINRFWAVRSRPRPSTHRTRIACEIFSIVWDLDVIISVTEKNTAKVSQVVKKKLFSFSHHRPRKKISPKREKLLSSEILFLPFIPNSMYQIREEMIINPRVRRITAQRTHLKFDYKSSISLYLSHSLSLTHFLLLFASFFRFALFPWILTESDATTQVCWDEYP